MATLYFSNLPGDGERLCGSNVVIGVGVTDAAGSVDLTLQFGYAVWVGGAYRLSDTVTVDGSSSYTLRIDSTDPLSIALSYAGAETVTCTLVMAKAQPMVNFASIQRQEMWQGESTTAEIIVTRACALTYLLCDITDDMGHGNVRPTARLTLTDSRVTVTVGSNLPPGTYLVWFTIPEDDPNNEYFSTYFDVCIKQRVFQPQLIVSAPSRTYVDVPVDISFAVSEGTSNEEISAVHMEVRTPEGRTIILQDHRLQGSYSGFFEWMPVQEGVHTLTIFATVFQRNASGSANCNATVTTDAVIQPTTVDVQPPLLIVPFGRTVNMRISSSTRRPSLTVNIRVNDGDSLMEQPVDEETGIYALSWIPQTMGTLLVTASMMHDAHAAVGRVRVRKCQPVIVLRAESQDGLVTIHVHVIEGYRVGQVNMTIEGSPPMPPLRLDGDGRASIPCPGASELTVRATTPRDRYNNGAIASLIYPYG